MDVRDIALTANEPLRQAIPHRFFMLIATSAALEVRKLAVGSLSIVGERGRDVEASYKYFPLPGSDTRWGGFELLSTVNQTVTVAVSDEQGDYAAVLQTIRLEQAADLEDAADQTVTTPAAAILAADADRVRAIVQNVGANNIRIGSSNVAAGRGIRLTPGGSATFQHTGAIYAIREGGSDSSVAVIEEKRS